MLWRQGDVFIETTVLIPAGAMQQASLVLADGELTGHSHRVEDPDTAVLFENRGELFLHVIADRARVIHEEHGTIELPLGKYRVWRQREYDPSSARRSDIRQDRSERFTRFVVD